MTLSPEGTCARLRELENELSRLRRRLLLLAGILPLEHLYGLEADLSRLEDEAGHYDPFEGWEETHLLTPTHIAPEMELLWKSLASRRER